MDTPVTISSSLSSANKPPKKSVAPRSDSGIDRESNCTPTTLQKVNYWINSLNRLNRSNVDIDSSSNKPIVEFHGFDNGVLEMEGLMPCDVRATSSEFSKSEFKDDKVIEDELNQYCSADYDSYGKSKDSRTTPKISDEYGKLSQIHSNPKATKRRKLNRTNLIEKEVVISDGSDSDTPLSPESEKKKELCSYLQLMKPTDKKTIMILQNRRSVRVKNLNIMQEKKEMEKRLREEHSESTNSLSKFASALSNEDLEEKKRKWLEYSRAKESVSDIFHFPHPGDKLKYSVNDFEAAAMHEEWFSAKKLQLNVGEALKDSKLITDKSKGSDSFHFPCPEAMLKSTNVDDFEAAATQEDWFRLGKDHFKNNEKVKSNKKTLLGKRSTNISHSNGKKVKLDRDKTTENSFVKDNKGSGEQNAERSTSLQVPLPKTASFLEKSTDLADALISENFINGVFDEEAKMLSPLRSPAQKKHYSNSLLMLVEADEKSNKIRQSLLDKKKKDTSLRPLLPSEYNEMLPNDLSDSKKNKKPLQSQVENSEPLKSNTVKNRLSADNTSLTKKNSDKKGKLSRKKIDLNKSKDLLPRSASFKIKLFSKKKSSSPIKVAKSLMRSFSDASKSSTGSLVAKKKKQNKNVKDENKASSKNGKSPKESEKEIKSLFNLTTEKVDLSKASKIRPVKSTTKKLRKTRDENQTSNKNEESFNGAEKEADVQKKMSLDISTKELDASKTLMDNQVVKVAAKKIKKLKEKKQSKEKSNTSKTSIDSQVVKSAVNKTKKPKTADNVNEKSPRLVQKVRIKSPMKPNDTPLSKKTVKSKDDNQKSEKKKRISPKKMPEMNGSLQIQQSVEHSPSKGNQEKQTSEKMSLFSEELAKSTNNRSSAKKRLFKPQPSLPSEIMAIFKDSFNDCFDKEPTSEFYSEIVNVEKEPVSVSLERLSSDCTASTSDSFSSNTTPFISFQNDNNVNMSSWPLASPSQRVRKDQHSIKIAREDGPVLKVFYVDYNLVLCQEGMVSFWTQTALGNVLGAQNMWINRGSVPRLSMNNNCILKESLETVILTDSGLSYIELWTKEHQSDKRDGPVADVFATVYYWKKGSNELNKKVLQLENINGFADDVQYCVLKSSPKIVVSYVANTELEKKKTSIHSYELASNYQKLYNITEFQSVEQYVSSLHNVEGCDTLIMGCGENKITLWNIDRGNVAATVKMTDIKYFVSTLWVKCDRGFLFTLQQCADGEVRLIAIHGINHSWKILANYTPPKDYKRLKAVYIENGMVLAFYDEGVVCWDAQTAKTILEATKNDAQHISGKYVVNITNGQVNVKHVIAHVLSLREA